MSVKCLGRQESSCEDDTCIKKRTEIFLSSSTWAGDNSTMWKGIVANSSVMP